MNIVSIPPIAVLGLSLYVGTYHLHIYIRRRYNREDLTFALLCYAISFFLCCAAGLYNVETYTEAVQWQRVQWIAVSLFSICFLWFIFDFTGRKPGILFYLFNILFIMFAVFLAVDRSGLTFILNKPEPKEILLPFNLQIVYKEVALGPVTSIHAFTGLMAIFYLFWVGIHYLLYGDNRKKAQALFLAMVIMNIALINDILVSNSVYRFIYLTEYGFIAYIILMALSLADTIVEAAITKDALRASEERFRTMVETISDWVWETDKQGVYTYSSPKVTALIGYTPEDVIGKTPFDFMPGQESARIGGQFREAVSNKLPLVRLENTALHKEGHYVVLETSAVPYLDKKGNVLGYRGVDRDITEPKKAEEEIKRLNSELEQRVIERTTQLEAAVKELEAFSYSISHDLRAPLRAVNGFSNILLDDFAAQLTPDAAQLLKTIHERSKHMERLIDDLLKFSRLSHQPLSKQSIFMDDLVRQICTNLKSEYEGRNIEVKIGLLPNAEGDPALLRQVWINLLSNAFKFTRRQTAPLVEIGFGENAGRKAYFVKDNGVGFDMKYAEKLFNVFQRLHRADEFEGTGIGLAIVARIVRRHGGQVWTEAKPGEGAIFYFTI